MEKLAPEAPELGPEGDKLGLEASEAEGTHPFSEPLPPEPPVVPHTNIEVAIPQFTDSKSEYEPVPMEIDYTTAYVIYQKAYQQAYQAAEAQLLALPLP